jgi:hypothetical protein
VRGEASGPQNWPENRKKIDGERKVRIWPEERGTSEKGGSGGLS